MRKGLTEKQKQQLRYCGQHDAVHYIEYLEGYTNELLAIIDELDLKIKSDHLDHEGYAPKTNLMGNHLIGKS